MRELTNREKRTLRIGGLALVAYLALFYGVKGFQRLEAKRDEQTELRLQKKEIENQIGLERLKAMKLAQLRETLNMHPRTLDSDKLVQGARSETQKLATKHKIKVGSLREIKGRIRDGELRRFHLDGTGHVLAVAAYVDALRTLGIPLVVDELSFDTSRLSGGVVRFSLDLALVDFGSWKPSGGKKNG